MPSSTVWGFQSVCLKNEAETFWNGAFNSHLPTLLIKYQTISGDPDGKEDENQLSACDIAVIAKHLLRFSWK